MSKKPLAYQVRKAYGDTVEEFAVRLRVLPQTVEGWENGVQPQATSLALLKYANKYALALEPRISPEFAALSVRGQIDELMHNFGDKMQKHFAARIGIPDWNITQWLKNGSCSSCAQRYLYEVAIHPERFTTTPKSYAK